MVTVAVDHVKCTFFLLIALCSYMHDECIPCSVMILPPVFIYASEIIDDDTLI